MNEATVHRVVRAKIAAGRLPRDRIGTVSATSGTNQFCDACSVSISAEEVVYKFARPDSAGFLFHATCFAIWRDERNHMTSVRAALD
jgi:hypothetical protein